MPVDGSLKAKSLAHESIRMLESPAGRHMGADRVFFSGGEPTIHLPYLERVVAEARRKHPTLKVNFDTNAFMTQDSLRRVLKFTTSITFDLKAYHDETMRALTGAPVEPVLRNAEIVAKHAVEKLWEFRIVAIPGVNEDDIDPLCRFLAAISRDLPVCFLAFRPNFVLDDHQGASRELMQNCLEKAKSAGLKRASYAGVTGISGTTGVISNKLVDFYERKGAQIAASYGLAKGCPTHPRDCGGCPSMSDCPVKRYVPYRSC
jgi:pyruvate formate lyase activating enzyme